MKEIKRLSPTLVLFSFLIVLLLFSSASIQAQEQKTPDRGFMPSGSYALGDIETVNTTNGNLMLNLPVAALPPGRGGLAARISLFYNSKLFDPHTQYRDCARTPYGSPFWPKTPAGPECGGDTITQAVLAARKSDQAGWRYGYKYQIELQERDYSPPSSYNTNYYNPCSDYPYLYYFKLFIIFPDGSKHEFRLLDKDELDGYFKYQPDGSTSGWNPNTNSGYCPSDAPINTKMVYYSTDGTYLRLEFEQDGDHNNWANNPWTLYLSDGTRVTGGNAPQRITDRNGNYIEIQENVPYNNRLADKLVDQVGRSIIIEKDGAANQDYIHQWGTNNVEIITTIKWKTIQVSKTYNAGGPAGTVPLNASFRVVEQITLPAQLGGLSYSFGYNAGTSSSSGWGEINAVTLPSGASAAYSYKLDGQTGTAIHVKDIIDNSPTQKTLTYLQEYDGASVQATEAWTYSIPDNEEGGTSIITGPDGAITRESFDGGVGSVYKSVRPDGTVIERQWLNNLPYGTIGSQVQNLYVKSELISITDANGNLVKTAVKDYLYDKNGNLLRVRESNWREYSSLHDTSGNPVWANVANVPFVRTTLNTYYLEAPEASESNATDPRNANVYNRDTSPRLRNAVKSSELRTGAETGAVISRTEFTYDESLTTGNLKEQRAWDSIRGPVSDPLVAAAPGTVNAICIKHDYNEFGNVIRTTDALGNKTEYTYGNISSPSGVVANLYPTETKAAVATPAQRTSTLEYDFSTGAVVRATDVDNNVSTSTQYDVFGRPKLVIAAEGKSEETRTRTVYSDVERRVVVKADLNTAGDSKLVTIKHLDQLGRVRLTRQLEDAATESETDETKGIKVQSRYRYSGTNSYQVVSNPYRAAYSSQAGSEPTMGWTLTKSDQAGRMLAVKTYSGYTLPTPWGSNTNSTGTISTFYDAASTTVTDQTQRTRRSETDSFGRLIKVIEDPQGLNYETTYSYDASSNLIGVVQGAQTRIFSYSSLSRLIAAQNPEIGQNGNGAIQYGYDNNGNLISRTDPRNITTQYTYDSLNRVTLRHYNDGVTADVTYLYDTLTYGKGRLTSVSSAISQTSYSGYDALGRITGSTQVTSGHTYTMPEYKYNLAGGLTSETYPSGRVVTTQYDAAGRASVVAGQKTGEAAKTYADSFSYTAHGGINSVKLGNNLWEHFSYNTRLQPVQISLGTTSTDSSRLQLDYAYGTTDNNGNVQSQSITAPGLSLVQSYTYDQLNRLKTLTETGGLTQSYDYDRYGNRAVIAGYVQQQSITPTLQSLASFNQNNNRIVNAAYDSAGNLQSAVAGHLFSYDAENKLVSHDDAQTVGVVDNQYYYDGDGRRVKKVVGSITTIYVYDITGQMVAEYTDYTSSQGSGTSYFTSDNLGTPRIITNSQGGVISRHDYLPFGEEISAGTDGRTAQQGYVDDDVKQKFTGKERDDETGLDFFDARYYSSPSGRFISPDPIFISDKQTYNPQLWNLYCYVGNNPLAYTDPTGMELVPLGQHTDDEIDARRKAIDEEKKAIRKDSSLTKAQQNEKRSKLEAEKQTLGLEKQGNRAARAFIERLESIGEGQGLQVSDFTLSTDPKNDFLSDPAFVSGAGSLEAAKQMSETSASGFMFSFVGYKSDIYINTTSGNYQLLTTGDADMTTYAGTAAVHERSHRDSPTRSQQLSEGRAYTEQLRVLQKFGPAAFKSSDFYDNAKKFVTDGSQRKD
ncbi:MAG TPA: RHS repeat-associated core domain-containing protein [Pyrinomonadaceae bacterium]|jgi:RHS repeat-associated protein